MNRPKGTRDVFGKQIELQKYVMDVVNAVASVYNFKMIDTPIFEPKEVFVRSVGETSDIVTKEMYVFKDKSDREMVLRPEGTAGTIRAVVENKLYTKLPLKVYYEGPMFRYENPQKGRQRQFTQFGVETIADKNPYLDIEIIMMGAMILRTLNIPYVLKLNSLGDQQTRAAYLKVLTEYFTKHKDQLSEDSVKRLDKNPLRILDDKEDGAKAFVKKAPKISEFYTEEARVYFAIITDYLEKAKINFEIDQTLVRGLDYYTDTAFEFISTSGEAGSQGTLIGGGRYENLVKDFGGPDLSGVGFALGVERIINEIASISEEEIMPYPHIFVLNIAKDKQYETMRLVEMFRSNGFITEWNASPMKLTKAFEKADEAMAHVQVIAGAKELENDEIAIRLHGEQHTIKIVDAIDIIAHHLGAHHETHK